MAATHHKTMQKHVFDEQNTPAFVGTLPGILVAADARNVHCGARSFTAPRWLWQGAAG